MIASAFHCASSKYWYMVSSSSFQTHLFAHQTKTQRLFYFVQIERGVWLLQFWAIHSNRLQKIVNTHHHTWSDSWHVPWSMGRLGVETWIKTCEHAEASRCDVFVDFVFCQNAKQHQEESSQEETFGQETAPNPMTGLLSDREALLPMRSSSFL